MTRYIIEKMANGWIAGEYDAFMHPSSGEKNVFLTLDAMNDWLKSRHPLKTEKSLSEFMDDMKLPTSYRIVLKDGRP